ncbi:MAG: TonB-dependent receptor [Paludibacteraceae bacterium]|nr:TonB-dependent receptor [Paludibacteraceae bacterium]
MKKVLLFLSVLLLAIGQVWAQSQTIKGTVLNAADEEPIIGASVQVKGTVKGTITDVNGKFSIEVDKDAVLYVSFIGMGSQEIPAADGMVVYLSENSKELEEVMVVAFGTTTKKSFTGSASVVKADEITKRQTSNVTDALAGQVAGVQGLSTSGQPGTVSNIRIRGIGSMSSSNAPLYVIDGIPATNDDVSTLSNADIETVTVLKDAASNALYGARGANGVILITTKRGSTRDAQVKIDAKWGTNQRGVPTYNVMTDPGMYYETFYQALYNQYGSHDKANQYLLDANNGGLGYQVYTVPDGERLIGSNGKLNPNATPGFVNTKNGLQYTLLADNWYNELFNSNNLRQEYNLSISGSTDKLTYFASGSYLDDSGIIQNSGFRRATGRVNVDYQAKKWLKIGTNMSYSHADMQYPEEDEYGSYSSGNLFYVSNNIAPIYPLYIRDGQGNIMKDANGYTMYDYGDATTLNEIRAFMNQSNPASAIELNKSLYKKDIFSGKWFVQIEPIKGLKFTANLGLHYGGVRYQMTQNPFYGQFASSGGYAYVSSSRVTALDQQYLANYANKFGEHNVDVMVGYENYHLTTSSLSGTQQKLFNPDIAEVSNAILSPSTSSATDSYFHQGILAQAKYDYASRYYVSVSYRHDGTSRFKTGHQWGDFWSVGLAWDIKGESFMDGVDQVDLLKLKASYGSQGNDNLLTPDGYTNYHPWADQYVISENNGEFATTLSYKGNPDITWETSYNFNAGLDFGFFGERLTGTIEGWRRRTENMLYYRPVPASLGYSYVPVNIGSVSNAGLDVELHGELIKTRNVTWGVYFNLSFFKNRILKLSPELNGQWIDGSAIYKEGESMYNRYLPSYAGVNPATGKAQWYINTTDSAGNVIEKGGVTESYATATENRYESGDILPKVYGGFGTNLNVYGVDLSVAFNYQAGGRIYDNGYAQLMHSGYSSDAGHNWHLDILNAWTPENTNTDVPALNAGERYENGASDRFLISSNYVSLQNITLGYTFPSKLTKKAHIEKIRVYAVADNVALWSARKGLDPRQGFSSANSTYYSPMRSISGGLSITF